MEQKHTLGPWFLGSDSDFIFDSNDENANTICRFFNRDEHDYDNKEANAKLIAAAPELFEACKILLTEVTKLIDHVVDQGLIDWEDESIDGVKDMDAAQKLALIAIKKATE